MTDKTRTDDEIETGTLPGAIVLGGVSYSVSEPTNARARVIRKWMAEYERNAKAANGKPEEQVELLEDMLDQCLRGFSDAIEEDWERIAQTATDRERLESMAVVRDAVMGTFMELAGAVTPAENRKARRAKK